METTNEVAANLPQNILFKYRWFAYATIGVLGVVGLFLAYNKYVENKKNHLEELIARHTLDDLRKNKSSEENKRIESPTDYVEKLSNRVLGKV